MRLAICLAVLFVISSANRLAAGGDKKPVPSADALAAAEKLVKQVFKDEYARTDDASKRELAKKLFENARTTNDDEAARFVLFREAVEVSGQVGELNRAFTAAEEMAAEFAVNSAKLKTPAIEKAVAGIEAGEERGFVERVLSVVWDAVAADDYESASRIVKTAELAARKSKNLSLFSKARGLADELEKLNAGYKRVQAALETLETKPDDPEANLVAGKHFCFVKGEWSKGLPMLVKGSDVGLRVLARQELESTDSGSARLTLADGWFDLAASETLKTQLQLHAYHLYKAALPELAGLSKAKAEKRLTELELVAMSQGEWAWMHTEIQRQIRTGRLKKWDIVGGAFSRETFEDVPADGVILIGFRYTTINGGQYPYFIQPIWRTVRGQIYGEPYGTPAKGAKIEETRAKPGYAVGAIYTRGGGGIDAIKPIYMKLTETGLDVSDSYEGPHIGGQGGGEGTVGGGGNLIVGLHGKIAGKDRKIEALSVVTLTSPLKRRD